jgi:hypothetical protein
MQRVHPSCLFLSCYSSAAGDGWAAALLRPLLHSGTSRSGASSVYSSVLKSRPQPPANPPPPMMMITISNIIYYLTINDGATCSYHASIDRVRMMMSSSLAQHHRWSSIVERCMMSLRGIMSSLLLWSTIGDRSLYMCILVYYWYLPKGHWHSPWLVSKLRPPRGRVVLPIVSLNHFDS